ncbi:hypothetical protein HYW41_00720 [Candidatus Daviesbacteria bacterium]|nr:hypothetical protein [Candidatus Daviesbacteria bacterium]
MHAPRIKVLIITIFSIILASLFIIQPVYAQNSASPSSTSKESKPTFEVSQTLPSTILPTSPIYTDLLVHNIFHTFSCLAVGQSVISQPCLNYVKGVPVLSSVNLSGGALGTVAGVIGALYQNPPVRTYESLASLGQTLGIVKEAKAQVVGSGAGVLQPIQTLWQVSRNISYVIMIVIFVIIGLMVIFRQRINPQTVITAQAAIPGLVIGLILITFSYFLAGLVSDTAFVGTNLVGAYFSAVRGEASNPQNLVQTISNQNVLDIFGPFTKIVGLRELNGAINSIWPSLAVSGSSFLPWAFGPQQVLQSLSGILISQVILPFGSMFGGAGQIVAGIITLTGALAVPTTMITVALSFVAMVILIYAMFRLLLRLINNYITIIYLTVTAPFQFLFAALPGRQGIATGWILNFLGNILAFPAVLAVFYFVAFILGPDVVNQHCTDPCPFKVSYINNSQNRATSVYAQEPTSRISVTDTSTFPLLGGFDLGFVNLLLAFGALVALPAIPDAIQRTVGKVSQAGQLIGQEIGAGTGAGQRYAGQFQQGVTGFAGQVGRVSDTIGLAPVDVTDPTTGKVQTEWRYNPLVSQAGTGRKIRLWFGKRFGKNP